MTKEKKTILVVEDNPLNMQLAADLLEINGFSVLKASDGYAALEILKREKPDLILLDIMMPGIDGFEVFKEIKKRKELNQAKVIALTAQAIREEIEKINRTGFDGYISKPIDTKGFVRKIKETLNAGNNEGEKR